MFAEFSAAATPDDVCQGLTLRFGGAFHIWCNHNARWDCATDLGIAPTDEWEDRLARCAAAEPGRPTIEALDDATLFIGVGVDDDGGGRVVVAGQIAADPAALAAQLAQLAVASSADDHEQSEQRVLLESYQGKLADSYEELSFLRKLSQHVEYCDASNSVVELAEAMIPSLRELMSLEGLALFTAACDDNQQPRVDELAYHDGKLSAAEEDWFHTIEFLTKSHAGIVVKNFPPLVTRHNGSSPLARVRSVVIAPVVKHGQLFGWLVGINKRPPSATSENEVFLAGSDEIGTMEATLLQAATVLLATHAANVQLFQEKEQLVVDTIHTLVGVIEAKDAYTSGHSDRVALLARRIAQQMGLSAAECHDIYLAGLLHDIGKVGVSDDVLLKPDRLTDEEFAEIRRHPEVGLRLLQRLEPLRRLLPGVMHHHESIDGTGYPHGLSGNDIPQMARILAVADAWDAMTSDRPYRSGMSKEKAEGIIRDGAATQWDAEAVAAFFAARDSIDNVLVEWRDDLHNILMPPYEADAAASAAQPRHGSSATVLARPTPVVERP